MYLTVNWWQLKSNFTVAWANKKGGGVEGWSHLRYPRKSPSLLQPDVGRCVHEKAFREHYIFLCVVHFWKCAGMDQLQVSENSAIDPCRASQTSSWLRNPNIQHLNRDIFLGSCWRPKRSQKKSEYWIFWNICQMPSWSHVVFMCKGRTGPRSVCTAVGVC